MFCQPKNLAAGITPAYLDPRNHVPMRYDKEASTHYHHHHFIRTVVNSDRDVAV
jgi:hypothetical protein